MKSRNSGILEVVSTQSRMPYKDRFGDDCVGEN